jgi:hypothetical protein
MLQRRFFICIRCPEAAAARPCQCKSRGVRYDDQCAALKLNPKLATARQRLAFAEPLSSDVTATSTSTRKKTAIEHCVNRAPPAAERSRAIRACEALQKNRKDATRAAHTIGPTNLTNSQLRNSVFVWRGKRTYARARGSARASLVSSWSTSRMFALFTRISPNERRNASSSAPQLPSEMVWFLWRCCSIRETARS